MSAAARAEARRKAILSRGTDRLSKLTTSARGESPVYMADDPPLPSIPVPPTTTSNFLGEESIMPTPPARLSPGHSAPSSANPSPRANRTAPASTSSNAHNNTNATAPGPDPSVWSDDQQQQLLQALLGMGMPGMPGMAGMGSGAGMGMGGMPAIGAAGAAGDANPFGENNPLSALLGGGGGAGMPPGMGMGMGMGGFPGMGSTGTQTQPQKPKPLLQKLLPLIHVVSLWTLLAYFVLWREPAAHFTGAGAGLNGSGWREILSRWGELGVRSPLEGGMGMDGVGEWVGGVKFVPFFYTFLTLEIALYSLRMFFGFDAPQLPMLLSFALPHLPPALRTVILTGLRYIKLGGVLVDDLALLCVGVGTVVWVGGMLGR